MATLLAVDDEPSVLDDLGGILPWSDLGIDSLLTATSGSQALEVMGSNAIDILMTDVRMPEMDGLQLIERVKVLQPRIRAVVLSAHDEFEYVRKALRLGVENYVLKPVSAAELRETIVSILKKPPLSSLTGSNAEDVSVAAFRQNVLQRWVDGAIEELELAERAVLIDVDLEASRFGVVVATDPRSGSHSEALSRASQLVERARSKLAPDSHPLFRTHVFLDTQAHPVFLFHGNDPDLRPETLARATADIVCADTAATDWWIAAGTVVRSPGQVRESYHAARMLSHARFVWPEQRVISAASIPLLSGDALPRDEATLVRFEHAVESAHPDACVEIIHTKWDGLRRFEFGDRLLHIAPYLLVLLEPVARECNAGDNELCLLLAEVQNLGRCKTYAELSTATEQFVFSAVSRLAHRDDAVPDLVRYVLEQVRHSFAEDLSLKTIAGQLNVNTSYLGQLLRTHTGELFHDYLTKVRMREARALLIGSDLRVSEIARRCGYPQQSYFNRIFKRSFGMTPVEYRRLARA
jgi:two-component system response regulator YesN